MTEPMMMSFDTFEQAQEWMAAQTAKANAHLLPFQKDMAAATDRTLHWLRVYHGDLLIFGRTPTLAEVSERERRYYPSLATESPDPEEASEHADIVARVTESRSNGYLYGECFSVIEPDGELGDTHVANVTIPITGAMFEAFRAAQWQLTEELTAQCRSITGAVLGGGGLDHVLAVVTQ